MNSNSYLCNFMLKNPNTWEEILTNDYNIKIKKEEPYAIFNYGYDCDFSNSIVQESRGIIIDYINLEVVCWPFRKFGNHNENYADKIDWTSARVLEKVDGSIIKLWYDKIKNDWQFSTNGTIRAEKAGIFNSFNSFLDVIKSAENYKDIPFESLDKTNTYIFELVSPQTQIVIDYGTTALYHLGTRNNITGKEMEVDIGIQKPKSYPLSSLEDCIKATLALNKDKDNISEEGYVVVDSFYNRVKVKSPAYMAMNNLTQTKIISKKECFEMLIEKSPKIDIMCKANPNLVPLFKYYEYKLEELKFEANQLCMLAQKLYEEYSKDRKAVADIITKHKLSKIAFKCLDKKISGSECLLKQPITYLINYIPDYQPFDFNNLFI